MAKATVYNKTTGERKEVTVGDPNAFTGGFELETKPTKSAGSLEGTLNQKYTLPDTSQTQGQFADFRNAVDMLTTNLTKNRASVSDVVKNLKSQLGGQGNLSPQNIATGVQNVGNQYQQDVGTIFRNVMRQIDTMEKVKLTQQENVNVLMANLASAGLLNKLTGEEFNQIMQTGVLPLETLQKISQSVEAEKAQKNQPSIAEQIAAYQAGGKVQNGEFISGEAGFDPITGVASDPSKVIDGYDFTSYASDKNWGVGVASILKNIPILDDTNTLPDEFGRTSLAEKELDDYIQSVSPNSPVKASDILSVAQEFNVDPRLMAAIIQQETQFMHSDPKKGGVGARGNNPANIGNSDQLVANGQSYGFQTVRDGLAALAKNMVRRQIATDQTQSVQFPTEKDVQNASSEERNFINRVLRLLPTKLKDSEKERADREKEALFDYRQGKPLQQVVDEMNGFVLDTSVSEEDKSLADNLRALASATDLELSEISAPINLGQPVKAMTNVENANLAQTDKNFANLELTQTVLKRSDEALRLLATLPKEYVGLFDFTADKWVAKTPNGASDADRQKMMQIASILTDINKGIRLKFLGSAVTETESAFLEDYMASMKDQPETIRTKLREMGMGLLSSHNSARNIVNLPEVNVYQLLDNNLRLDLYRQQSLDNLLSELSPEQVAELQQEGLIQ